MVAVKAGCKDDNPFVGGDSLPVGGNLREARAGGAVHRKEDGAGADVARGNVGIDLDGLVVEIRIAVEHQGVHIAAAQLGRGLGRYGFRTREGGKVDSHREDVAGPEFQGERDLLHVDAFIGGHRDFGKDRRDTAVEARKCHGIDHQRILQRAAGRRAGLFQPDGNRARYRPGHSGREAVPVPVSRAVDGLSGYLDGDALENLVGSHRGGGSIDMITDDAPAAAQLNAVDRIFSVFLTQLVAGDPGEEGQIVSVQDARMMLHLHGLHGHREPYLTAFVFDPAVAIGRKGDGLQIVHPVAVQRVGTEIHRPFEAALRNAAQNGPGTARTAGGIARCAKEHG